MSGWAPVPGAARAGGLRDILAVSFVVFVVYQLTLVLLPYHAALSGYRELAAGSLTATFMAGAVIGPLVARTLFARDRLRVTLAWSIAIHAASTLLLAADALVPLLLASLVRGVTFGVIAAGLPVAIVHSVAEPDEGAALGLWGAVCTIPAVFAPTVAVWASEAASLLVLMGVAALITLLALLPLSAAGFASRSGAADAQADARRPAPGRLAGYGGPALVFLAAAATYGAVASFAPLFLHDEGSVDRSVIFLLAMGVGIPIGRMGGGTAAARHPALWLPAGLAFTIGGLAAIVASPAGHAAAVGGASYGLGFGIVTTMSQLVLLQRSARGRPEDGSVVFSVLFNAGIGAGGLAMGALAELVDLRAGFIAWAIASGLALPLAYTVGRGSGGPDPAPPGRAAPSGAG